VFVNKAYPVPTKNKATIIFHCSIPKRSDQERYKEFARGKTIIATSVYSGQQWALYLGIPSGKIHIVLPFADPIFGNVTRSAPSKRMRILFAGRLHPEKGIYTILEMMHQKDMRSSDFSTSIVEAGLHVEVGREIARMLKYYPYARLISAQKTVKDMAKLLAKSDVLLMPSVFAEPFGMLSVEAQHAGCRVIASNIGGLPETNCGLLTLVTPRSPVALLTGIKQGAALGVATRSEREDATAKFTLSESVDELLKVLHLRAKA
jgi:glycosyltransferase involved in cell wall biosynthesis